MHCSKGKNMNKKKVYEQPQTKTVRLFSMFHLLINSVDVQGRLNSRNSYTNGGDVFNTSSSRFSDFDDYDDYDDEED